MSETKLSAKAAQLVVEMDKDVELKMSLRSPHVSRLQADALAEVDFLVREYAASDEDMTDGAAQMSAVVSLYVRRWAALCGFLESNP